MGKKGKPFWLVALVSILIIVLCFGFFWLEIVAFQWLLAQFGLEVGFWKAFLMLLVIDVLLQNITARSAGNRR